VAKGKGREKFGSYFEGKRNPIFWRWRGEEVVVSLLVEIEGTSLGEPKGVSKKTTN